MPDHVTWYLASLLIAGGGVVPATVLFHRLPTAGVLLARPIGFAFVALAMWMSAAFTPVPYGAVAAAASIAALYAWSAWILARNREMARRVRGSWHLMLTGEALFITIFAAVALLRAQTPAALAIEKPMELMLLTVIHNARDMPPPDAWLSGRDVSYYHLGYVMVDALQQISSVPPARGLNLGFATTVAMAAVAGTGLVRDMLDDTAARSRLVLGFAMVFGLLNLWLVAPPTAIWIEASREPPALWWALRFAESGAAYSNGVAGWWWLNVERSLPGVLAGLPLLAGPPSWSAPTSVLAWLPLTVAVGLPPLFIGLMVVGDVTNLLTRQHAHGKASTELSLLMIPFAMVGTALGWLIGGASWGISIGTLAGMATGAAAGFGLDAAQEKLVSTGWLHYEREGCCERSRINPIEAIDIPGIGDVDSPLPASAFMGSLAARDALLAALSRQRARAPIVRDDIEPACDFRIRVGCPVPCQQRHHASDGDPSTNMDEHHLLFRSLHGVPPSLSSIENVLFSNLPLADAAAWPERFVGAIQPGSDLDAVSARWMLWLLAGDTSPLEPARAKFTVLASLLRKRLDGDEPDAAAWRASGEFSATESWMVPEADRVAAAVARYGVAASDLDAARDLGSAMARAGQLAAYLQRRIIETEQDRVASESRNPAAASIISIRRSFGKTDWDPGRAWEQMADRLVDELRRA